MSKEYYCTPGNRLEFDNQSSNHIILNITYGTKDKDVVLSEEDAQSLADIVNNKIGNLFTEVLDMFPEISELDISISEKLEEDS